MYYLSIDHPQAHAQKREGMCVGSLSLLLIYCMKEARPRDKAKVCEVCEVRSGGKD